MRTPYINFRFLAIGLAMIIAAGLAFALTPTSKLADKGKQLNLESLIPEQFGNWHFDKNITPISVSPDVRAQLDLIYNQTLSRTYVNNQGQRIMLSIAYGGDQRDSLQVHMPEGCYRGQGFSVSGKKLDIMNIGIARLPVTRLMAEKKLRNEPITYWVVIGGAEVTRTRLEGKLAKLRYTLTGNVPDGILVRVSSLDNDKVKAYSLHDQFVRDLLSYMPAEDRRRLVGRT